MVKQSYSPSPTWHLVTGEYPPQRGGVSDYTQQLARALANAGERVHIWAPGSIALRRDDSLNIHGLPGFGLGGLRSLSAGLAVVPGRRRLLVQYVATAFGCRGMNLPFAFYLAARQDDELWVQFHEVAYGVSWNQPPQRNLLAAAEWWMAQLIAERADRIFISVPGWRRQLGRQGERAEVLPIPSNVPIDVRTEDVLRVQGILGDPPLIGHFGTYGASVADLLEPVVVSVLREARNARFVFLGHGGREFVGRLEKAYPDLAPRLVAPGSLGATDVSTHIAACDLLVQPYPDGISGRRTSAMAGLALGKPMVTTIGPLTEDVWARSGAVASVPTTHTRDIAHLVIRLLSVRAERERLSVGARALYRAHFSMEHTLDALGVTRRFDMIDPWRNAH